ncbi:hypothetical protein LTR84_011708 [Exophiala bonariae]|uniref:Transposase Tc1-like domain-containing protein n=1 Tax=Exophiala bonariae TaxID=1690606 RepID=A0AAV9NHT4_9EURO|nr:hypothetical protein LTR84_011708 [Exophiala bonariae]
MPSGGSHQRYDETIRTTITQQLEAGIPCNKIAWFNRVSTSFVSQLNVRRKTPADVLAAAAANKKRRGPVGKISREAHDAMVRFVDERSRSRSRRSMSMSMSTDGSNSNSTTTTSTTPCTHAEVAEFLRESFGVEVSGPTISRTLKKWRVEREREREAEQARERERERERDARLRAEVAALVAAGSTVDELRAVSRRLRRSVLELLPQVQQY